MSPRSEESSSGDERSRRLHGAYLRRQDERAAFVLEADLLDLEKWRMCVGECLLAALDHEPVEALRELRKLTTDVASIQLEIGTLLERIAAQRQEEQRLLSAVSLTDGLRRELRRELRVQGSAP